jgi:hypothetical protein
MRCSASQASAFNATSRRSICRARRSSRGWARRASGSRSVAKSSAGWQDVNVIYFMAPDNSRPSGGVRVIYDYADTLSRAGLRACVWHGQVGFRCRDYASAPIVSGESLSLKPGDLLVVPEWGSSEWGPGTMGAPKVVLNQNHFISLQGLPEGTPLHNPYPPSPDVVAAISTSRAIDEFLGILCPNLAVHFSPVSLNTDLFKPAAAKQDLMAWMPRRRPIELRMVTETLRRRGTMAGWEFIPLDGVPLDQVANVLGRAKIFLLGNERDGLGLPGLEAMASGCQVIGFLGGGGKEYGNYPLCTPIEDGDIVGMVEAVERTAQRAERISTAGVTATKVMIERDHGRSMCEARMVEIFLDLTSDGSPALVEHPVAVQHVEYQAIQRRRSLRGRTGAALRRMGLRD